ncbi:MAG: helix-turn-helix domain-containing protein [Pseudomonadota bacterium]
MSSVRSVELLEKNKPQQARAKRTYEAILASAARLLVEIGVERISTNLIAEGAGITVPALYRYFPNKYAVLHALGAALMDKQNSAGEAWLAEQADGHDPGVIIDRLDDLLRRTYEVTLAQEGGVEIIQALRAVAPLREVRLTSHQLFARQLQYSMIERFGLPDTEALALTARLAVDMGYAVVEMALETDDLPPEQVLAEGANMLRAYVLARISSL